MSTNKFSWVHLSDLHVGQQYPWLWPNFKAKFLEDLRRLSEDAGPIDLVVFSGDLTQCGEKDQYEALTRELKEIWEMWDKLGQHPQLFTVPGNHDLERPPAHDARVKMLTRWNHEPDVVREFWSERNNQYVDIVRSAFANYTAWQEDIRSQGIPCAPIQKGLLPGDASSSLVLNGISVGLIGLNSSFLQLIGGDFNGQLAIDLRQLSAITDEDPPKWCNKHHTNFLVSHHPPSWLSPTAHREYQTEIYPPGRFTAHFFGHMHDADMSTEYRGGAAGRKTLQSSSLFGMQFLDGGELARVHGYSVCQISLEKDDVTWRLWPRKAIVSPKSGDRKIIPDHDNFDLVPGHEYQTEPLLKHISSSKSVVIATPSPFDLADAVEVGAPQWNNALHSALYSLAAQEQHLAIRPLEQKACIESIRQKKIAWVCADWGLGRDGFIWSVLRSMGRDTQPVYRVGLENYRSRDEFLTNFVTLAGCSFPEFCKALAAAGPALLLLDDSPIGVADHVGASVERDAESLAIMVRDFCPDIVVLLLARTMPRDHKINVVMLEPLDEADTRTYLMAHPGASTEVKSSHSVSEIYRRTDGLTGKIDSTLKTLRVVSLSELGPANLIESTNIVPGQESIPASLVKAVAELAYSKDPSTKRAYLLLKALAILPHGESLQRLKRFYPQSPVFPANAEELLDRDLIQVRSSTTLIGIKSGDKDRMKILVAPRPVRDYVLSQMSSREIDALVLKATSLYFGEEWRSGRASLRKVDDALTSDDGSLMENPHTIVMRLLKDSATWDGEGAALPILNLCHIYCNALFKGEHYRNCAAVCGDVLSIVPEARFEAHRDSIMALCAKALRMTGEHDRAKPLFVQLLATKQPNAFRSGMLLHYALCLQSLNDQEAIKIAKEVIDLAPKSASALQAKSIIIEMEHDADSLSKLRRIEKEARRLGYNTVANNLALARAANNDDYSSLRLVHSTALAADDGYTAARAVVKLATIAMTEKGALPNSDLNNLVNAYGYFYGERFGSLFSKAHEALWHYFESRGDIRNLLSLFRHSSFIWRLNGSENREQTYIKQLSESARQILAADILTADKNTAYFIVRARNGKLDADA